MKTFSFYYYVYLKNLSIAFIVRVGNLGATAGYRFTGAIEMEALREVVGGVRPGRLAHSVDLKKSLNHKKRKEKRKISNSVSAIPP